MSVSVGLWPRIFRNLLNVVFVHQHFIKLYSYYRVAVFSSTVSVVRGHSDVSYLPQPSMTSDFEGFISRIVSITCLSYLNS